MRIRKFKVGASKRAADDDAARDEYVIVREHDHGFTLCGFKAAIDTLIERVGSDTAYLTTLETGDESPRLEPIPDETPEQLESRITSASRRVSGLETDVVALRRGEAAAGKRLEALEAEGLLHCKRLDRLEQHSHPPADIRAIVCEEINRRELLEQHAGEMKAGDNPCGEFFTVRLDVHDQGDPTVYTSPCNRERGHAGPHMLRQPAECTCARMESAWEENPEGHAVGCALWGSREPNRNAHDAGR